MPLFSIVIPSYNRRNLWENHKLLDSLYNQTETDAEAIIIDDASTDGTIDFLKQYIQDNPPPFPFRLVKCLAEKKNSNQSSTIPDNIGFLLAKGKIFCHVDDDCIPSIKWLEYTKSLNLLNNPACIWGNAVFINPKTLEPLSFDSRLGRPTLEAKKIDPNIKMIPLKKSHLADWGALYCAPSWVIKEAGGHSMELSHRRGIDAMIGWRIRHKVPTYFCIEEAFTYLHFDNSWLRKKAAEGERGLKEIAEQHKIPFPSYFVKNNEVMPSTLEVNGGIKFWDSSILDNLYQEIEL